MDLHHSFSMTPTVDTSAYATGDLIGGKQTLNLSVFLGSRGACILDHILVVDQAKQSADIDLVLFGSDPSGTTFTDQAALDVADADMSKIIGIIPITTHHVFSDNSLSRAVNLDMGFRLNPTQDTLNLYGAIVSRATPTFVAATDLRLTLTMRKPHA